MIVFILGQIIRLEGLLMIIPCLTSLIDHSIYHFSGDSFIHKCTV